MKRLYSVSIILLLLLISVSSVLGLLDSRCTNDKLVSEDSDAIVDANVVESNSYKESPPSNNIYTITKVQVSRKIKDQNLPDLIEIRTEGGEFNGEGQHIEDQPEFRVGDYGRFYLKVYHLVPSLLFQPTCGRGIQSIYTNHNANDNVCCIDEEGRCNKNIQSANSNNYQKCFPNEDCYVPECIFGCCKSETGVIRTCSFTTASACIGSTFYENVKSETCEALCREEPPEVPTREEPTCNPIGLQEINIMEASGGRFNHIDSMYYNGSTYLFFVGDHYFTLASNPLERRFKGPFDFYELTRKDTSTIQLIEDLGGIDEVLDLDEDNIILFKNNNPSKLLLLRKSDREDRPGFEPGILERLENIEKTLEHIENFVFSNNNNIKTPTPFSRIDAALKYHSKLYFIDGNNVYIYSPQNAVGKKIERVNLNDIIPGCNSIDSAMYDRNSIYISKGEKAWIYAAFEPQEIKPPTVDSLSLSINRGIRNFINCSFILKNPIGIAYVDINWKFREGTPPSGHLNPNQFVLLSKLSRIEVNPDISNSEYLYITREGEYECEIRTVAKDEDGIITKYGETTSSYIPFTFNILERIGNLLGF